MEIIDISMYIHPDMRVYKDRDIKRPEFTTTRSIAKGERANETRVCMDSHTGTHIDAIKHFLDNGETITEIPLDRFAGPCQVLDLTDVEDGITAGHLKKKNLKGNNIVLFKTRNSFWDKEGFDFNFIYLEKTGAQYLVEKNIKSVGIDALGIERDQPDADTHTILLNNKIPIIEGLILKDAKEGDYTLFCLPIKLKGLDAAPARAVLIKKQVKK